MIPFLASFLPSVRPSLSFGNAVLFSSQLKLCCVLLVRPATASESVEEERKKREREYFDTVPWSTSKEKAIYLPHERERQISPTFFFRLCVENRVNIGKYWPEAGLIGIGRQVHKD